MKGSIWRNREESEDRTARKGGFYRGERSATERKSEKRMERDHGGNGWVFHLWVESVSGKDGTERPSFVKKERVEARDQGGQWRPWRKDSRICKKII